MDVQYNSFLFKITEVLPAILTVLTATATILGALYAGVLKKIRLGAFEIEGVDRPSLERIKAELAESKEGTQIPFEIEQLANYYSLTLGQAKVSFWFSLVFASIGFLVIVGAAILYKDGDYASASIKIISGLVIDGVSALFFVQSRRAQESMSAFFEKLRNDRQFVEARKICDEISDHKVKDKLKTILTLHYSGLETLSLIKALSIEPLAPQANPPSTNP